MPKLSDRVLTVYTENRKLLEFAAKITKELYPGTEIKIEKWSRNSAFIDAVVTVDSNMLIEPVYNFFKGYYMGIHFQEELQKEIRDASARLAGPL